METQRKQLKTLSAGGSVVQNGLSKTFLATYARYGRDIKKADPFYWVGFFCYIFYMLVRASLLIATI